MKQRYRHLGAIFLAIFAFVSQLHFLTHIFAFNSIFPKKLMAQSLQAPVLAKQKKISQEAEPCSYCLNTAGNTIFSDELLKSLDNTQEKLCSLKDFILVCQYLSNLDFSRAPPLV
jgi:hypothetical protein